MDKVRSGEINRVDRVNLISNLNPHDVKELTNKFGLESLADYHGSKYTEHMINSFVAQMPKSNLPLSSRMPRNMLMASKLPANVVDLLHPNIYQYVRRSKLKPQHLENAIERSSILGVEATKHLAQEHQLPKLVTSGMVTGYEAALHPKFTKAVHNELVGMGHNDLLINSKHASIDDIGRPMDIIRLAKNTHIDHSTPDLKDLFMSHIKSSTDGDMLNQIFGHGAHNTVPTRISDHFTDADYNTFAHKRIEAVFSDADAHKKFAQASLNHIDTSPLHAGHAASTLLWYADTNNPSKSDQFMKASVEKLLPHKDSMRYDEKQSVGLLVSKFLK